jgi:shikimate kinase
MWLPTVDFESTASAVSPPRPDSQEAASSGYEILPDARDILQVSNARPIPPHPIPSIHSAGDFAMVVVVMGVAGSGKTTVGRLVATRLGWRFCDADDLHPEVNRRKMRAGIALTDEDRRPWLDAVRGFVAHLPGHADQCDRRLFRPQAVLS